MRKLITTSALAVATAMAAPAFATSFEVTAWRTYGECVYFEVNHSVPWYAINSITYATVSATVFAAVQIYQLLGDAAGAPSGSKINDPYTYTDPVCGANSVYSVGVGDEK